jgi:hypothetical protein
VNVAAGGVDRRARSARAQARDARPLPLGASATLVVDRPAGDNASATIPAAPSRRTRVSRPCGWFVEKAQRRSERFRLRRIRARLPQRRGARVRAVGGELVVTAGVQKMAPGLKVAFPGAASNLESKQAAR